MTGKERVKRYVVFLLSLFFMGLGIAFTKHCSLGVSPVSSLPNVVSIKLTMISFGTWVTITNCLFVLGQVLVLRRKFKMIQLLQLPLSFVFGFFTDFGLWMISGIPNDSYIIQLLLLLCGIVILGFGIMLGINADVLVNAGEAFVKALADTLKINFGNMKIIFDVSCILLSTVLSLVFFDGKVLGIREGTMISALLVGTVVKLFNRGFKKPLLAFITNKNSK